MVKRLKTYLLVVSELPVDTLQYKLCWVGIGRELKHNPDTARLIYIQGIILARFGNDARVEHKTSTSKPACALEWVIYIPETPAARNAAPVPPCRRCMPRGRWRGP